jgi:hypothetical protein
MEKAEKLEKREFLPRERWLNFALALGPAAWLLHLNVSYLFVTESCGDRTKIMLHAITAVCVVLALIAAAIAWRIRAACAAEPSTTSAERMKWTSTMVLVLSLSMVVVILAQQIPNLILRSCD